MKRLPDRLEKIACELDEGIGSLIQLKEEIEDGQVETYCPFHSIGPYKCEYADGYGYCENAKKFAGYSDSLCHNIIHLLKHDKAAQKAFEKVLEQ